MEEGTSIHAHIDRFESLATLLVSMQEPNARMSTSDKAGFFMGTLPESYKTRNPALYNGKLAAGDHNVTYEEVKLMAIECWEEFDQKQPPKQPKLEDIKITINNDVEEATAFYIRTNRHQRSITCFYCKKERHKRFECPVCIADEKEEARAKAKAKKKAEAKAAAKVAAKAAAKAEAKAAAKTAKSDKKADKHTRFKDSDRRPRKKVRDDSSSSSSSSNLSYSSDSGDELAMMSVTRTNLTYDYDFGDEEVNDTIEHCAFLTRSVEPEDEECENDLINKEEDKHTARTLKTDKFVVDPGSFYIDSGATTHVTPRQDIFVSFRELKPRICVKVANKAYQLALGIGNVKL